jgi:hypothetical protein
MIRIVKIFALFVLLALQFGCETAEVDHYNRRDLYSPEPETRSPEAIRQLQSHPSPTPDPKPQFRG